MTLPRIFVRNTLMAALAGSFVMVIARTSQQGGFYLQPHADTISGVPLALLFAYFVAVCYVMRAKFRQNTTRSFSRASMLGLAGAGVQCLGLAVERFLPIPGRWNGVVTLLFLLVTFSFWARAAFRPAAAGKKLKVSVLLAVWSAVVTMSVAVAVGAFLSLYIAPESAEAVRGLAEFHRSGWTDVQAFAVANTLDSMSAHLGVAPLVATLFGFAATKIAARRSSRQTRGEETATII